MAIFAILFAAGGSNRISAQVLKGQIIGTVTDQSGAVVPAVKITITETRTNLVRTTETNDVGNYFLVNLDPGEYRVEVQKTDSARRVRAGIDLQPNTTVRVNVELAPAPSTRSLKWPPPRRCCKPTVPTPAARSSKSNCSKCRSLQPQLRGPAGARAGSRPPTREHSEFYNSQDSLSVRVNGQGRQFNNFQIEGIENKIDNGNLTALVPSGRGDRTVDISTSNFDPEFGNAGGAVTNVTLRSGTNDYHGSAFRSTAMKTFRRRTPSPPPRRPPCTTSSAERSADASSATSSSSSPTIRAAATISDTANRATIPGMRSAPAIFGRNTIVYDPSTGTPPAAAELPFAGNIIPETASARSPDAFSDSSPPRI